MASKLWTTLFSHNSEPVSYIGGSFIALVLGIVILTVMNEGIYSRDKYRLIPVTDGTLYFGSMLTAIVSFVYLMAGEIVIYIVSYKIAPNPYDKIMIGDFNSVQQYLFKFEALVAFILGVILVWSGITLLHLLVEGINDFLPFRNQSFVKIILAIVIIWIFMIPFNFITENVLRLMGINNLDSSFSAVTHVMYASMGMMVIWTIIFTIINLYLLNKWSETTK
ncbi:hypothetical protein IV57_GL002038 [Companilactobacillus kimchiensis]|uniref:Uncharacterized protein n=1 Tax=Companilactobacillus kimchiensis TaxID=993692 RepID=A0A0R2LEW2_9LACO|nr:hypothetical protein IV57_GL002038 [Companilactobacillus kimchiensis]